MAAVIEDKKKKKRQRRCAFPGAVIYLIAAPATPQSFCLSTLQLRASHLSPRVKGRFVCWPWWWLALAQMEISLAVVCACMCVCVCVHACACLCCVATEHSLCPSLLFFLIIAHRLPFSPLLCCLRDYAGSVQYSEINQSKQNPMPYYPWRGRERLPGPTELCDAVWLYN